MANLILCVEFTQKYRARYYDDGPEDFHVKIAETPEEIKGLLEVGFEYVCEKNGLAFFRKRK